MDLHNTYSSGPAYYSTLIGLRSAIRVASKTNKGQKESAQYRIELDRSLRIRGGFVQLKDCEEMVVNEGDVGKECECECECCYKECT